MGEVISGRCQLKLKENQAARLTTEKEILEAQETNKIRGLFRVICEIPEKPIEIELRKKREIEIEWGPLEEIKEVDSADRIDQLKALRFKTQMGNNNLSRGKAMKFWEMKYREWGNSKSRNLQQIRRLREENRNWRYWDTCGFCANSFL